MTEQETFFEALRTRRSVRQFTERVPEEKLLGKLIEAAQWAPSNHNRQGWKFIVFRDRAKIADLAERIGEAVKTVLARTDRLDAEQGKELVYYAKLFARAPVAILALHKKSPAVGKAILEAAGATQVSSEAISTAMAVENMLLAAHVLGLGACVMTAPLLAAGVWKEHGDLPAGYEPTCVVAVGYPAETPAPPRRKPIERIVEYR